LPVTDVFDKQTAITPGTVSGASQCMFGCGAAGPGGWRALNADSTIHVEGGSADEITVYSQAGAASLLFNISAEFFE
jgi:hypothetical protein